MITEMYRCKRHPTYKAIRAPRVYCPACDALFQMACCLEEGELFELDEEPH